MIAFAWHVFLVVWITGALAGGVIAWNRTPAKQLERQVTSQALQTRIAELQARERRALDV